MNKLPQFGTGLKNQVWFVERLRENARVNHLSLVYAYLGGVLEGIRIAGRFERAGRWRWWWWYALVVVIAALGELWIGAR